MKIYLASQSPRRRELLSQIDVNFQMIDINITEKRALNESPTAYVSRVAMDKAVAGWESLARLEDIPVLGADTEVVFQDDVFGKPESLQHAVEMIYFLSGKTHQVISSVALCRDSARWQVTTTSEVSFNTLTQAEVIDYCNTEEYVGKAGAYAIQGRAARFISHINGSYSAVMGLPLFETYQLIQDAVDS